MMKLIQLDLTQKNAAISVIFTLEIFFFITWLALGMRGLHPDMDEKVWTIFFATNSALFLILNSEAKKDAGIDVPPENTTATTVTKTVEATTTSIPPADPDQPKETI